MATLLYTKSQKHPNGLFIIHQVPETPLMATLLYTKSKKHPYRPFYDTSRTINTFDGLYFIHQGPETPQMTSSKNSRGQNTSNCLFILQQKPKTRPMASHTSDVLFNIQKDTETHLMVSLLHISGQKQL